MTWTIKVRGTDTGFAVADFRCPEHGLFDALVERPVPDHSPCPECSAESAWSISSPRVKHQAFVSCHRGKSDEKPFTEAMDTEALADGKISYHDWKKQRREMWHSEAQDEYRRNTR